MFDKLARVLYKAIALAILVLCCVNLYYELTEHDYSASELMNEYISEVYGPDYYGEVIYETNDVVKFNVFADDGDCCEVMINKEYYTHEFNQGS